jgi:hypothetical protein
MTPKPPVLRFRPSRRRTKMTVCIAAAAFDNPTDSSQIVLCHDWQGTVPGVGCTDAIDKQRYLGNGWIALMAGDLAHAEELVAFLDGSFPSTVSAKDVLAIVRSRVFAFRKTLVDQLLMGSCGIDFERFVNDGQKIYPPTVFGEIHRRVLDVSLNVQMIVTGFSVEQDECGKQFLNPCLIQIYEPAPSELEVSLHDSFTCIGEGASAAQTFLLFRNHDRFNDLMKTAYHVFEAKTMAEIVPTVGASSTLYLQRPGKELMYLSSQGFDACNAMFKQFGPKKISRKKMNQTPITKQSFQTDKARARFDKGLGILPDSTEATPSGYQTSEGQK